MEHLKTLASWEDKFTVGLKEIERKDVAKDKIQWRHISEYGNAFSGCGKVRIPRHMISVTLLRDIFQQWTFLCFWAQVLADWRLSHTKLLLF
jgi:hypothetical protein